MESKPKKFTVISTQDRYEEYRAESQEICELNEDGSTGKRIFWVNNLCECPEDAIIGRDLFDASDFINAVEYGMNLAKLGYTDIETTWVEQSFPFED